MLSAARHTHDLGYSKWDAFDVDEALAEVDRPEPKTSQAGIDSEGACRMIGMIGMVRGLNG